MKIFVLVEGQTEEAFIKQVLAPALPGLWLVPSIVKTKVTGARPHKGGTVAYEEFRRQLNLLLRDPTAALVTTMFDYVDLDDGFPGRAAVQGATSRARVTVVERAIAADVNHPRFRPYLSLHEFEAMLFVQPERIAEVLQEPRIRAGLLAVRGRYAETPEDINDSPATSPSARIETLCEEQAGSRALFSKRAHGPIIAARIGLDAIRAQCPHFHDWVSGLEALTQA